MSTGREPPPPPSVRPAPTIMDRIRARPHLAVAVLVLAGLSALCLGVIAVSFIINPPTAAEVSPAGFRSLGDAYDGKYVGVTGDLTNVSIDARGHVIALVLVDDNGGWVEMSVDGVDWIRTAKRVRAVGVYDHGRLRSVRFTKVK